VNVLYDVCADRSAVSGDLRWAVIGLLFGGLLIAVTWSRRDRGPRVFAVLFLAVWLGVSLLNAVKDSRAQRAACAALSSGAAKTAEGPVTDFSPLPADGRGFEVFKIGGTPFRIAPGRGAGLTRVSSNGGPIRPGRTLRVTYAGEEILKVEEPAR
jgi:hypothetical protein